MLQIENLNTSNGPDLKVWSTNAPVMEGVDGWGVFDDLQWVDLSVLKGNQGSQNYEVPADVDLSDLTSMSLWCERSTSRSEQRPWARRVAVGQSCSRYNVLNDLSGRVGGNAILAELRDLQAGVTRHTPVAVEVPTMGEVGELRDVKLILTWRWSHCIIAQPEW